MTNDPTAQLKAEIAKLEAAIAGLDGLPDAQAPLREQLAARQRELAAHGGAAGPVVTAPHSGRDTNIATSQTIVNLAVAIYGRDPGADQRAQLARYLDRLAARLSRLPLRGLDERLDRGDGIALAHVYVMLATDGLVEVARGGKRDLKRYFEDGDLEGVLKTEYHPDHALPDQALIARSDVTRETPRARALRLALARNRLATEALATHPLLVLRGDPGSGKSTFVRYVAWALAEAQSGRPVPLLQGWSPDRPVLPVFLPLRALAGTLARHGATAAAVFDALRAEVERHAVEEAHAILSRALDEGVALLLLDGLDEVPLDAVPGVTVDRATVLRAVRDFTRLHTRARVLLTTRTRAFEQPAQAELGWPITTLAPFTLGQVRHFTRAWYAELAGCGQIEPEQAEGLAIRLVEAIEASERLREMARTPLLLTLMALVLYNKGELPRDRPQLYERILELLLGQWDRVREGQSLAEALTLPDWTAERFRPLLDRLSYEAHRAGSSLDGRGRLARSAVRDGLIGFFQQAGFREDQAMALAGRCLDYFSQRSGLLVPDDAEDSYVFAHLTLQEHCAGCAIVTSRNPIERILEHRGDDRWIEAIRLGLGVAQPRNPFLVETALRRLITRAGKTDAAWQHDLVLAAEIGVDRDWAVLREQGVDVDGLQDELRTGLVALLADCAQPLPVARRVRAGFLLGDLGDPRFPVSLEEWQRELAKVAAGDASGYFCRVPAGDYVIGSADDDPDATDEEQPQHAFRLDDDLWVARLPVTNAQWHAWVASGGEPSHSADDTDLNGPNQPVVSITWSMARDFCAWLSGQLVLPPGLALRLPSEQEWEAAARGGDARRYPWGDDWRDDYTATEEDQDARAWSWSVPVGCYPVGAAPCDALDLAGNVLEWTASDWRSYPGSNKSFTNADRRVLRGGGYGWNRANVRCGARLRGDPDYGWFLVEGLRVVLAPPLAHMS